MRITTLLLCGLFGLVFGAANAETLTPAQIKQIEDVAKTVAAGHNANSARASIEEGMASTQATATGRNVRFVNVLKVKKGLPPAKLKEFSNATQAEVMPKVCAANAKNPAFDRGLTYTFAYANTYGESLAEFSATKATCAPYL